MKICCLFNSKKSYAYRVGVFMGDYKVELVKVIKCKECDSVKIKKPDYMSSEYQSFLCDTFEDIVDIANFNGIPILNNKLN